MKRKTNFQKAIFDGIIEKVGKKSAATELIAKKLEISKDATYRRLRGETFLTPQEIAILAEAFDISLDTIVNPSSKKIGFEFNQFSDTIIGFDGFIDGVLNRVKLLAADKSTELFYATHEIPLLQYFFFPELLKFKLYVWGQIVWESYFLKNNKFSFDLIPHPFLAKIEQTCNYYCQIPSTEFWSTSLFENTLNQIYHYYKSGDFEREEDAFFLIDQCLQLSKHMRNMAKEGQKFVPGESVSKDTSSLFNLYNNEVVFSNIVILAKTDHKKYTFSTYCNPNFLQTSDEKFCSYTYDWFQLLMEKSLSITRHGQKERQRFFNICDQKIKKTKKLLEVSS